MLRAHLFLLYSVFGCAGLHWPAQSVPLVAVDLSHGALVGTVVSWTAGEPLSIAQVTFQPDSTLSPTPPALIPLDTMARFAIPSLAPGRYRLIARALGYIPLDTTCQVEAGKVDTLIVMLDAQVAGTLQIRSVHDPFAASRPHVGQC